jgi:hypothetical protein
MKASTWKKLFAISITIIICGFIVAFVRPHEEVICRWGTADSNLNFVTQHEIKGMVYGYPLEGFTIVLVGCFMMIFILLVPINKH